MDLYYVWLKGRTQPMNCDFITLSGSLLTFFLFCIIYYQAVTRLCTHTYIQIQDYIQTL